MTEKTAFEYLIELDGILKLETPDKSEIGKITAKIFGKKEGKEVLFKYFEDINTTSNQKKVLLTSLSAKNTTAVFNSISVEQRIAFLENLKLTREQNELFNSWNVKCKRVFCGQVIKEEEFTTRYCWKVDKERETYLAGLFYSREFEGEVAFVFRCNQQNYIVQFHKRYEEKTKTVIWDIPLNYIIDAKFPYGLEKHLIDDLKNALYAYNYDGLPFNSDNEYVRSIFNF